MTRPSMTPATISVVLAISGMALGITAISVNRAWPHPAKTVAGEPLGITYSPECCNSAATSPTGDCAPISDLYVTERSDGYHVDLPIGGHPRLLTKGYHGIIPYSTAKQPISNDYHICLATDGAMRFCFFPKPGAV